MSDPVFDVPREIELTEPVHRPSSLALLRRRDFATLFAAVSISELGDALNSSRSWLALRTGGPLGVVAVRLADSIPGIVFGLHGGSPPTRWSRRKLIVGATSSAASCSCRSRSPR